MSINPTKTWEYIVNHIEVPGGSLTDRNQRLWLALKRMLTDTGGLSAVDAAGNSISITAPMIVVASSDGVTADATDRWTASSDIVGAAAGVAHSWIHLRLVDYFGAGDHLNCLLSVEDVANCSLGYVAWARGALGWNNDGTITNRPTLEFGAVALQTRDGLVSTGDEKASDAMWGLDSSNLQAVVHYRISDDGQAGSWKVMIGGATVAWHGWQRDEEGAGSDHTNDFWVWGSGLDGNGEIMSWSAMLNTLNIFRSVDNGSSEINAYAGATVFGASEQHIANTNLSTQRWLDQIPLGELSATYTHGLLTDTWWGSTAEGSGDQSPTTPPVTRAQFGQLVEPWPSGVNMLIS